MKLLLSYRYVLVGCFLLIGIGVILGMGLGGEKQAEKELELVDATELTHLHSLPIVSIIADSEDLWSAKQGIFAEENLWNEREISIQLQWYEEDQLLFETEAGMRLFGGESRMQPQKSLALLAKKKYGDTRFEYPFFPNLQLESYKSLVLRNSGQDFSKTHFLDGMVSTLLKDTELDVQAYRPVIVYINDQYWGMYDLREKITVDFLVDHHGGNKKNIDLLESDGEVKDGDEKEFRDLLAWLRGHDLADEENYEMIETMIDLENLIDYFIAEIYIANQDWPDHNIRYWRSDDGDGRWRWIVYDTDLSFQHASHNTLQLALSQKMAKHPSNEILQQLMKQQRFRTLFLQRFASHMQTTFGPERAIAVIREIKETLAPEMGQHIKRWGGSIAKWEQEIEKLEQFAQNRPQNMRNHIQQWFKLSDQEMIEHGF